MKFKAKTERSDQKKEGEHMVRSIVEALAEYSRTNCFWQMEKWN